MSQLPSKPIFGGHSPSRYPPDYRPPHGRPPMPHPDRYREHDVYAPRSPRGRYAADSYVPPRAGDSYRARQPADSYVAPYREGERYADYWERDWRAADDRHRPGEQVRPEWEADRMRRWDWDPYGRRDREYSPSRYRDGREDRRYRRERPRDEPERTWTSRPDKSPPRRMAPTRTRSPRSPGVRGRTPASPDTRAHTPVSRPYSRPSSPGSSTRPGPFRNRTPPHRDSRFGGRVSPRRTGHRPFPRRSRSRDASTASPDRPRGRPRYSRSPSPPARKGSSRRNDSTDSEPKRSDTASPVRKPHRLPIPQAPPREVSPPLRVKTESPESRAPSLPPIKDEQPEECIASPIPVRAEEKGKMKETEEPKPDDDGDVKMPERSPSPKKPVPDSPPPPPPPVQQLHRHRSRSPPVGPRNYAPTPPTPSSPRTPRTPRPGSNLPPKPTPEWARRRGDRRGMNEPASTPNTAPDASARTEPGFVPAIPKYNPPQPQKGDPLALCLDEIGRLRAQRVRLATEYASISKSTRRAFYELELAALDLRAAENRRAVADAQLEKARVGQFGIDYVRVGETA